MKILFITGAGGIDYQSDCLFHGLVDAGHDVTDSRYLWYLSEPLAQEKKAKLYGRGFTLSATLPDRSSVDRSGIPDRIASHEFDAVVFGSIARCADYLDLVRAHYTPSQIAIVDGEDDSYVRDRNAAKYFKRELTDATSALPISFAIPASKIRSGDFIKSKKTADIIPGKRSTYRFTDENDYYHDYSISQFGETRKKAGWDCLRHYEILAAGALTHFIGMEGCPQTIMTTWPWRLQMRMNMLYARHNGMVPDAEYIPLLNDARMHLRDNMTTVALANYVISQLG